MTSPIKLITILAILRGMSLPWDYCYIRKIEGCACAGEAGGWGWGWGWGLGVGGLGGGGWGWGGGGGGGGGGGLSRHSRRMRNPRFYVSGERPIAGATIRVVLYSSLGARAPVDEIYRYPNFIPYDLQWLDLKIGYQDRCTSINRHVDRKFSYYYIN